MMEYSKGLVIGKSHQGDRPYMEDYIFVTSEEEDCFMAIYDGHGGYEAAKYAYDHLWETIKVQNGFYDGQQKIVSNAIIHGFMATHENMRKVRGVLFCVHASILCLMLDVSSSVCKIM